MELVPRRIAHLRIEEFCAALEEFRHPELRRQSFVLASSSDRSIVQGVNRQARLEGLKEGMPLSLARRLCRRLQVLLPDNVFYREQHQVILQALDRFSPLTEGTSLGSYFIDLTGTRKLFGPEIDTAYRIGKDVLTRYGMGLRIGLASNRLLSQVVTQSLGPEQFGCLFPGSESAFLAPLPLKLLPGVGSKTTALLGDLNLHRVGELASIPEAMLVHVLGSSGVRLSRLARGIDPTPVLPTHRVPRIVFHHTLKRDEIDQERLAAFLFEGVEEAGWHLRLHNRYPERFALTIRYADGSRATGHQSLLPQYIQSDQALFRAAHRLCLRLWKRRIALRGLELEFTHFAMPLRQRFLFPKQEAQGERERHVQKVLDKLRLQHGRHIIAWGRVWKGKREEESF